MKKALAASTLSAVMLRAALHATCMLLATAPCVQPLLAQRPPVAAPGDSASLRGVVVSSTTGNILPFAIISIPALNLERFANQQGQFTFPRLPVGTYRLRVRQLGYTPALISVTMAVDASDEHRIELVRIAQQLTPMSVASNWECRIPGLPKNAGAVMLEAFGQLEQNADRMRLLRQEFPFEVDAERWQMMRASKGSDSISRRDTTIIARPQNTNYKPGKVLYAVVGPNRTVERFVQVPTLLDFADNSFQSNHCFVVRGLDDQGGATRLRIDFKPLAKINTPDVEGSVFLDSATYQLRSAEFRMTAVPASLRGTRSLTFTTLYRELSPGLPVVGGIHAVTELNKEHFNNNYYQIVEDQTAVSVRFLKQRSDSVPH